MIFTYFCFALLFFQSSICNEINQQESQQGESQQSCNNAQSTEQINPVPESKLNSEPTSTPANTDALANPQKSETTTVDSEAKKLLVNLNGLDMNRMSDLEKATLADTLTGFMLVHGTGVDKDPVEAFYSFLNAAEKGKKDTRYNRIIIV